MKHGNAAIFLLVGMSTSGPTAFIFRPTWNTQDCQNQVPTVAKDRETDGVCARSRGFKKMAAPERQNSFAQTRRRRKA